MKNLLISRTLRAKKKDNKIKSILEKISLISSNMPRGRYLILSDSLSLRSRRITCKTHTENYLSLIFRKINDFVHRFILDHKSVDFTILVVNITISYC
jgi:hypothetical protein